MAELQAPREPDVSSLNADARDPLWIRAADALTVLLLASAASIAVYGGFKIRFGNTVITAHSAVRLLLFAVALAAVRHYFAPTPTIAGRTFRLLQRVRSAEPFRAIAPSFVLSRAVILFVAYLSVINVGYPQKVAFRVSDNELQNLPARWDAGWYLTMARHGYYYDRRMSSQHNLVFFPLFPLVTRAAGVFVGAHVDDATGRKSSDLRLLWAGVLVNLAAFAAALGYLYRMVRAFAGKPAALAAVQFALAYPVAFIFNAAYSEGMFLLAAIATFYHFGRSELASASAWGIVAGLTRSNGFILAAPLVAIALARSGPWPRLGVVFDRLGSRVASSRPATDVLVALAPVAGMLIYSAYLYATWGDPFLWAKLQAAWGRSFQGFDPVSRVVIGMVEHGMYEYTAEAGVDVLHVLLFALAVGLSIPIARRLGLAYSAFILFMLTPPLVVGGWLSMSRFTVVLFPLYVYLGIAVRERYRIPLMIAFAALQGFGTVLFFTWRPFF
jgi:hypothetical protein